MIPSISVMNTNFSVFLYKQAYLYSPKLFHNSSYNLQTHYDTLKLQKNCTQKEIRDSFIQLSKQNHPDINKSPMAHKEFLKIQEAYNVLSKPYTRAGYDLGLASPGGSTKYGNAYPFSARARGSSYHRNPWDDPSFYHNRDKSQDVFYKNRPYYGIKGIKKQSNGTVALVIVAITLVVFTLQMTLIRLTFMKQQTRMNRKSQEAQQLLNEIREKAERNGNQVQLELLQKQFEERDKKL